MPTVSRRQIIGGAAIAGASLVARPAGLASAHASGVVDITQFVLPNGTSVQANSQADESVRIRDALRTDGNPTAWYFPEGVYLLQSAMNIILTRSISVTCHENARFVTNFNGDVMKFLAEGGFDDPINVIWYGGKFDTTTQPVSKVVPFRTFYTVPPALELGTAASNVATMLVFSARTIGGVPQGVFGHIGIHGVTITGHDDGSGGHHWELAGGDTGIYITSCRSASITGSTFEGCRDLGIYLSEAENQTTVLLRDVVVSGNIFDGCCGGAAVKRGGARITASFNTFKNCVRGFISQNVTESPGGIGGTDVAVVGNNFEQCWQGVLFEKSIVARVAGNIFANFGHVLAGPSAILDKLPFVASNNSAQVQRASAINSGGSYLVLFERNVVDGLHASWTEGGVRPATAVVARGRNGVANLFLTARDNWVRGIESLALETPGEAASTKLLSNFLGPGVADFVPANSGSLVEPLVCS